MMLEELAVAGVSKAAKSRGESIAQVSLQSLEAASREEFSLSSGLWTSWPFVGYACLMAERTPPPITRVSVPCPVCGERRAQPYRPRMYRIGSEFFDLVRCACGMVYVDPQPDGPTVGWMYDDPEYYTHGYNLGVETENYFTRQAELIEHYTAVATEMAREVGAKGRLCEIGAAGGFFMEGARRAGFDVCGVELSPPALRYAREQLGLDVFAGEFEDAPYPDQSFDFVVADNVLEHSTDLQRLLRVIRRRLKPGGHVWIVVPSYVNSPYFRILDALRQRIPRRVLSAGMVRVLKLEADDTQRGMPYHLLEFNQRLLERIVREAGLDIVRCEGSVPLPAELFKNPQPSWTQRGLAGAFLGLDLGMRVGILPGARLTLLAKRRP